MYMRKERKKPAGALALILIIILLLASIGAAILGLCTVIRRTEFLSLGAVLLTAGILAFVLGCILPGQALRKVIWWCLLFGKIIAAR